MSSRCFITLQLFLAWLVCAPLSASSTDTSKREFTALCEREMASDNVYFGKKVIDEYTQRISLPAANPRIRARELASLSFELIRLGRHEDALKHLADARDLFLTTEAPVLEKFTLMLSGVAHFQLAENLNCALLHSPTACILPIGPDAVHTQPAHSRAAGDFFLRVLQVDSSDIAARWMLNLSRMVSGDYPEKVPQEFRVPMDGLADDAGPDVMSFLNAGPALGLAGEDLAGGAIMDDFDGDGLLDIVTSAWHPCSPMKAYRNTGEGGFEDVSAAWGLDSQLGGLNLVHADFDNDGALDILVLRGAWLGRRGRMRNSLLRNDLSGEDRRFVDVTARSGLAYPAYPTQAAAWADFDLDGDLDLAIANEGDDVVIDPMAYRNVVTQGHPLQLFRNEGNGRFTDVAREVGLDNREFGKGIAWGDIDNDGDPDLYVSNLGDNQLYRNERISSAGSGADQAKTVFTDISEEALPDLGGRRTFATWFFDQDNDGDEDIFVGSYNVPADAVSAHYLGLDMSRYTWEGETETLVSSPLLLRNEGGRFTDVSEEVGLDAPLLVMGANFGDLDNDGEHDLYLGTGMPDFTAMSPNVFLRGHNGGFVDQTLGSGLGNLQKGHAVAFGDLDNDGDQDLLQQLGGAFPFDTFANAVYVNPHPRDSQRRFLNLEFRGTQANAHAVGGRVQIDLVMLDGTERSLHRTLGAGGSFGASSLRLEVGLGEAERVTGVRVRWPDGSQPQSLGSLELNSFYRIKQGEAPERLKITPIRLRGHSKAPSGAPDHTQHQGPGQ